MDGNNMSGAVCWLVPFHQAPMKCAHASHGIERSAYSDNALYWNPCLGIPPMVLFAPAHFFGIQFLVGKICLISLLLTAS